MSRESRVREATVRVGFNWPQVVMSVMLIPLPRGIVPPGVEVMCGKANGSAVVLGAPMTANSNSDGMIQQLFRIIEVLLTLLVVMTSNPASFGTIHQALYTW